MKRFGSYLAKTWTARGNFWNVFFIWVVLANSVWYGFIIIPNFLFLLIGNAFVYVIGFAPESILGGIMILTFVVYFPASIVLLFLTAQKQRPAFRKYGALATISTVRVFGSLVSAGLFICYFSIITMFMPFMIVMMISG